MPYDVRTLTHCSVHWTEALRSHRPEKARSHHRRDRSSQQRDRSAAARAEAAAVAKTAMAALLASTQPLTEADDAASTCWRREGRGGPEPRANTDTL